jgi:hypothetical protein
MGHPGAMTDVRAGAPTHRPDRRAQLPLETLTPSSHAPRSLVARPVAWFAAALAVACSPAADAPMTAKTFQGLGGEYSQQCSDPASLRAFVERDALTLRYRDKSASGTQVRESTTYAGSPALPKPFSMALVSTVADAGKLAFVFYAAKDGNEMAIDADAAVLGRVGLLRLSALRFRKCG